MLAELYKSDTFSQAQLNIEDWLDQQVGKPYSEVLGQNQGPYSYDCQGLCFVAYDNEGINIDAGIGGSAAQYWKSPYKVDNDPLWLPCDQVFFYGGETSGPRPGHTGIFIGITNGVYRMINAYDTEYGVIVSTFDPHYNGGTQGLSCMGRTRPLLQLGTPPVITTTKEYGMILVFAEGPEVGNILPNSWWEYTLDANQNRVIKHVQDTAHLVVTKKMYGQNWATMSTADLWLLRPIIKL